MGQMFVKDHEEDTFVEWNLHNRRETERAETIFNFYKSKGFVFFEVLDFGTTCLLDNFHRETDVIIIVPAIKA